MCIRQADKEELSNTLGKKIEYAMSYKNKFLSLNVVNRGKWTCFEDRTGGIPELGRDSHVWSDYLHGSLQFSKSETLNERNKFHDYNVSNLYESGRNNQRGESLGNLWQESNVSIETMPLTYWK